MMKRSGLMIMLVVGLWGICYGMVGPVHGPTELSNEGNNFYPVFSPDSKKIVFQSDRSGNMDIWLMNIDGSDLRRLTSEESDEIHPAWSTDGSKIVFSSDRGGSYDIWRMDISGQNWERLTKDNEGDEFWPRYSPVAFAVFKRYIGVGDVPLERETEPYYKVVYSSRQMGGKSIWLMDENGSNQENITQGFNDCDHPEWSPLGEKILFDSATSQRGKIGEIALYQGRYQYYKISREVSYIMSTFEGGMSYPNYSPNNVNVYFVSGGEMFIADKKQLKQAGEIDKAFKFAGGTYLRWSPNGKKLVYTSIDEKGRSNIYIADSPILLSNVMNLHKFTELNAYYKKGFCFDRDKLAEKLRQDEFVVIPGSFKQFYHVYEEVDYNELPVFITTDSILHTYHIFFDFTLRKLETDRFYAMLKELSEKMFVGSLEQYKKAQNDELKKICSQNVAFFAVGNELLNNKIKTPGAVKNNVQDELKKIEEHGRHQKSSIFNQKIDYTQFVPRGHYTRSEKLKRYFKAMMWYGQVMYRPPYPAKGISDEEILRSLLIYSAAQKAELFPLWDNLYDPILFFVGGADDLSLNDYHKWVEEIYGGKIDPTDLSKKDKLNEFIQRIKGAKNPKIGAAPQEGINPDFGVSFRFMPQRFTPDAKILQGLVYPLITEPPETRGFPMGLDVMAVLGSQRAYQILDEILGETKNYTPPEDYPGALKALTKEFSTIEADVWQQNLYWGWLYTLKPLLTVKKEEYPGFMQKTAWQDKELFTALGSWTELKHDTILYAKQPYGAEGGGGIDEIELPIIPKPRGYIEPNFELYKRLAWLTRTSGEGLKERNLIDEELGGKYNKFQGLIAFMQKIAGKELKNESITEDEYAEIREYGTKLERITMSVMEAGEGGDSYQARTDEQVALVSDVYTNVMREAVLEEAVGNVFPIYVIVQQQNKDYLTVGGVFSYYEFAHPMDDRLTDEKWQKIVEEGDQPPLPVWTESFIEK